jgi:septin 7
MSWSLVPFPPWLSRLMEIGESGLGKSTLVNTLFNASLYSPRNGNGPTSVEVPQTVNISAISADIEENGVRLRLNVVDTPGFGDFVNNEDSYPPPFPLRIDNSWKPILECIESRFDAYLEAENKPHRTNIIDNRIHACIYFIQPTGHSLKPLDIEFMRRLHSKVILLI